MENEIKRPDRCQLIDKDPIEIKKRLLEVPIIIMPDWTTPKGGLHSAYCPEEIYRELQSGSLGYRLAAHFKTDSMVTRQILDYPTVNPPIQIFVRNNWHADRGNG